jgi:hypothetical protein
MPDELLRPTISTGVDLSVRPWRLMSQTYVAFFGGVISATLIAFLNARRLGVAPDKRRLVLLIGGIGLVLAAVVMAVLTTGSETSSGIQVAIRVVAIAACLIQLRIQRPMDRAFQLRGGDYGSLWGPGTAAVIGGGLLEAVLLAIVAIAL